MKNFDLRGAFYERVCILCERYKGSITSGYRTEKRNKEVGGSEYSQHRLGYAFDVILDDHTPENIKMFIADCWRMGLVPVEESSWIHIQAFPKFNANA